jgi:hypothetical protein
VVRIRRSAVRESWGLPSVSPFTVGLAISEARSRSYFSFRARPPAGDRKFFAAAFAVPLVRLFPLQHDPDTSIYVASPGLCLTRYVPSPGFLTLLTACSRRTLPAVFQAGALMGFRPFRASSSVEVVTSLDARSPLVVPSPDPTRRSRPKGFTWSAAVRDADFVRCMRASTVGAAYRASHLAGVRVLCATIKPSRRSLLSWDWCLFRASRCSSLGRAFRPVLLPWASSRPSSRHRIGGGLAVALTLRSLTQLGCGRWVLTVRRPS